MSEALLLRLRPRDLASGRPYVERDERPPSLPDELALGLWHGAVRPLWRQLNGRSASARRVVALTRSFEPAMASLDDTGLRARAAANGADAQEAATSVGVGAATVALWVWLACELN
mgnify:CR=1 FL=1